MTNFRWSNFEKIIFHCRASGSHNFLLARSRKTVDSHQRKWQDERKWRDCKVGIIEGEGKSRLISVYCWLLLLLLLLCQRRGFAHFVRLLRNSNFLYTPEKEDSDSNNQRQTSGRCCTMSDLILFWTFFSSTFPCFRSSLSSFHIKYYSIKGEHALLHIVYTIKLVLKMEETFRICDVFMQSSHWFPSSFLFSSFIHSLHHLIFPFLNKKFVFPLLASISTLWHLPQYHTAPEWHITIK